MLRYGDHKEANVNLYYGPYAPLTLFLAGVLVYGVTRAVKAVARLFKRGEP